MSDVGGLLQALTEAKQRLSQSLRVHKVNMDIIGTAPHAHNCPVLKRSVWHVPVVIDAESGEPRPSTETDCTCWKAHIAGPPAMEGSDTAAVPAVQNYSACVLVPLASGDRYDLLSLMCTESGFDTVTGDDNVEMCVGGGLLYTDVFYRMMTLIGELRLQKFNVLGYKVVADIINVKLIQEG